MIYSSILILIKLYLKFYGTIIPAFKNRANLKDGCYNNPKNTLCMVTGDPRTEDNAFLFLIQTLFWYEHNRIAKELSKYNPYCSDETLFQESRRILIGLFQKIIYNDWAPIALGEKILRKFDLVGEPRGRYFYGYCYLGYIYYSLELMVIYD